MHKPPPQMSTNPTPTPPHKLTQLSGKWFRTLYELLHEVHTIKICIHHCNDEIASVPNTCENAPEKKKWAKVQSKAQKYSPVDLIRSGRFGDPYGRVGARGEGGVTTIYGLYGYVPL